MRKCKKILGLLLMIICCVCVYKNVHATTITAPGSAQKGKSITITVSVPNVNTVDLTATVSGAGTSGTIRLVDGSMTGEAKTFSKSITVTPTSAGTITVSVSAGSNAVLNGQYVNVDASKSITVTEPAPPPAEPTQPTTPTPPPTNNNNTPSNNNVATNKPTTNTTTNSKSSNANLKNMILSVEGLSPAFSKDITNYSLNVGEKVNDIKVNASVEHSRAVYSVSGNTGLKEGENVIKIRVTAEDGTVKTYTINVLKSDDPVKSDATLYSLIIEGADLDKPFDPNVLEYNLGDIGVKEDKLNIYAYTNAENAKIEIIGNEDLGVGEGKITIRVTSENGKITKDYIISFNKLYEEETNRLVDIYGEDTNTPNKNNENSFWNNMKNFYNNTLKDNMTVIVLYIFVWVEFVQVVYLYEKLKKHEDLDKITVGKIIKREKVKTEKKEKVEKVEKPRRVKENPIFPEEENK